MSKITAALLLVCACNLDLVGQNPGRDGDVDAALDLAADGSTTSGAVCQYPLSDFCAGSCPTYDGETTRLRMAARCFLARFGTCGALQFIEFHSGGIGDYYMELFDSTGTLVFAHHDSDTTEFCQGTSYSADYGTAPSCKRVVTETLCYADYGTEVSCSLCGPGTVCLAHLNSSCNPWAVECVRSAIPCAPGTCSPECNAALCGTAPAYQCQPSNTCTGSVSGAFLCYGP
jgi:hypothetical protein